MQPTFKSGRLSDSYFWSLIIGLMGFFVGFLGLMILNPSANHGPLLGIFITGPIGFIAGGIYGLLKSGRKNT